MVSSAISHKSYLSTRFCKLPLTAKYKISALKNRKLISAIANTTFTADISKLGNRFELTLVLSESILLLQISLTSYYPKNAKQFDSIQLKYISIISGPLFIAIGRKFLNNARMRKCLPLILNQWHCSLLVDHFQMLARNIILGIQLLTTYYHWAAFSRLFD